MRAEMDGRRRERDSGQANLTVVLLVVGLIVAGVWIWKRLPPDVQDTVVDRAVPYSLAGAALLAAVWIAASHFRRRLLVRRRRDALVARFQHLTDRAKRLDLAFQLIELNGYRAEGLDAVAEAMTDLFLDTLKTALDDKQHRIRGMAASHLGALQAAKAVPALLKALEDDHAYVRGCAALALGRMRATEAKTKLAEVMKEDWDQTVRSRAREALERIA